MWWPLLMTQIMPISKQIFLAVEVFVLGQIHITVWPYPIVVYTAGPSHLNPISCWIDIHIRALHKTFKWANHLPISHFVDCIQTTINMIVNRFIAFAIYAVLTVKVMILFDIGMILVIERRHDRLYNTNYSWQFVLLLQLGRWYR